MASSLAITIIKVSWKQSPGVNVSKSGRRDAGKSSYYLVGSYLVGVKLLGRYIGPLPFLVAPQRIWLE